ncbi:MAG TPA: hypothetical protein VLT91_05745 [Rhizomicrobium sp.]|nr:hypothetical protein [Rhizomicrobium sp.]
MGQQHNPNQNSRDNSMNDERAKKAQQNSDRDRKHGMPGTFKNDPDGKPEKSKSHDSDRH